VQLEEELERVRETGRCARTAQDLEEQLYAVLQALAEGGREAKRRRHEGGNDCCDCLLVLSGGPWWRHRELGRSGFGERCGAALLRLSRRRGARDDASGLQISCLSFSLPCRTGLAGTRRARRRKGERLKRFGQHWVEVSFGGDAGGDVRIEILAGTLRHEDRNVSDQCRVDDWIIGRGNERGGVSGFHREWATAAIRSACSLSNSGLA